ncbi:hypothetical protein D3C76_1323150 [compost metagenome]
MLGPGHTAISADENLCVMTDRPAVLAIDKIHCREQLPGRHLGLGPGLALVIGEENMTAIANSDQSCTCTGHVEQQAFFGSGRFGGVNLRFGRCCLDRAGPQPHCQHQHCAGGQYPWSCARCATGTCHVRLGHRSVPRLLLFGSIYLRVLAETVFQSPAKAESHPIGVCEGLTTNGTLSFVKRG